jgi:glycerol uptake facilitator-like aquaporin
MKVVALAPDLMFGSRVRELLGAAGHEVTVLADRPAALVAAADADALVVDLVTAPGGEAELAQAGVPVLGIYAHTAPEVRERALAAVRKIRGADAAIYIVMQLIGAILAALVVKLLLSDEGEASSYGGVQISEQFLDGTMRAGLLAELIGTFALMWAIMATAVNVRAERSWAPFVIGGTLAAAVMAIGPLTGAGFNPARAFGPDIVAGIVDDIGWGNFLAAYALGPIVGAVLAVFAYTAIVLGPQEQLAGGRLVDTGVLPGHAAGQAEGLLGTPGERPVDKLD